MPYQLIRERIFTPHESRSRFVQSASFFQDVVIRCVRYAFAHIPATIGAVFFSKNVAAPFMRFRMLRHGHFWRGLPYTPVSLPNVRGAWLIHDNDFAPDIIVYYCHGGGFSMGSSYFYLEFLTAWMSLLKSRQGYRNPAIFALDYTLVPEGTFPRQLNETKAGYEFVLSRLPDGNSSRVCVAGDSAGATLILSLLLSLGLKAEAEENVRVPGFATMISPWCELLSEKNQDTQSDYLNADSLHLYARQYTGLRQKTAEDVRGLQLGRTKSESEGAICGPLASPGNCHDKDLWKRGSPTKGYHFIFGSEEVFAAGTRDLVRTLRMSGVNVEVTDGPGIVHAWPVVNLFLGDSVSARLQGLDYIVEALGRKMIFG